MDIIEQTRLLGRAIQESHQYRNYCDAKDTADKDEQLQNLIGEFNLIRMQLNEEIKKEDKDSNKVNELNEKMRKAYNSAMSNPHMKDYTSAKTALDSVIDSVKQIIDMVLIGDDPMTCEPSSGCSGSCATCGGCR